METSNAQSAPQFHLDQDSPANAFLNRLRVDTTRYPLAAEILSAVCEEMLSRGETVSTDTLLCGLLITLETKQTNTNLQICSALLHLISCALHRIPKSICQPLIERLGELYCTVMKQFPKELTILQPVLMGLADILALSQDAESAVTHAVVDSVIDLIPCRGNVHISKSATTALATILKRDLSEDFRSEICFKLDQLCMCVFEEPNKAATAISATTSSKKRSKLQDRLDAAALSLVYTLKALMKLLPLGTAAFIQSVVSRLWDLFSLQRPELSAIVIDVFKALFEYTGTGGLDLDKTVEIISHLNSLMERSQSHSLKLSVSFAQATYAGLKSVKQLDTQAFLQSFAQVLSSQLNLLMSEYEEVRQLLKQNLTSLLTPLQETSSMSEGSLMDRDMDIDAPLSEICQCFEFILDTPEEESLAAVLPVVKALFKFLARQNGEHTRGILEKLGDVYDQLDTVQNGQTESMDKIEVVRTIGAGMIELGISTVLHALPLNISKALEGSSETEPRAWLLPAIKKYAVSDSLTFWMDSLHPVAQAAREKAVQCAASNPELAFKCTTVEKQIWATLPSFAHFSCDAHRALPPLFELLERTHVEQPEHQDTILSVIKQLCQIPLAVLEIKAKESAQTGLREGLWFSMIKTQCPSDIPAHMTDKMAEMVLEKLRAHSGKWFEVLSSAFISAEDNKRQKLGQALAHLAAVSSSVVLNAIFQDIKNKLYEAFQDNASSKWRQQRTYLSLLWTVLHNLDDNMLEEVLQVAVLVIKSHVSHAVQKAGYRILAYILENRASMWIKDAAELVKTLEETCDNCTPASLIYRLRCIKAMLATIALHRPHSISYDEVLVTFLPEVTLALVEANSDARDTAQHTLQEIGQHFAEHGRFDVLVLLLQQELTSPQSSMIAKATKAFECLMRKFGVLFAEQIGSITQTVLQLAQTSPDQFTSPTSLDILLEFIKTASVNLPLDALADNLEAIVAILLEWHVPMQKARAKTKALIMHLCELVEFETVQKYVPDKFGHLMRNLRKLHRRSEKQTEIAEDRSQTEPMGSKCSTAKKAHTSRPGSEKKSLFSKMSNSLARLSDSEAMENVDLLDPLESRRIAKAAAGIAAMSLEAPMEDDGFALPVNSEGKLVITERSLKKADKQWRKRTRDAAGISDKDDAITLKSTARLSKRSEKSQARKSQMSKATNKSSIKSHHSGKRFKSKKGAGGDVKGTSQLEPYAYWKLDRNLLNKRRGKQNLARGDLKKI